MPPDTTHPATREDLQRVESKLDSIVDHFNALRDRIIRLEERSGVTASGLEIHRGESAGDVRAIRGELRGVQARVAALELARAQADGSGRTIAIVWGVIVSLPGLVALVVGLFKGVL